MKVLYLEAKKKSLNLDFSKLDFSILPKKIALLYSIQFKPFIKKLKKELECQGKKVYLAKGFRAKYKGQVLGCDAGAANSVINEVDSFLFLSSGKWHAKRVAMSLLKDKPFFMLTSKGLERIYSEDLKNSRKALLSKFYYNDEIGILISLKAGQENLELSFALKKELEKMGKKVYVFIADNINASEFENFGIKFWINSACPGLAFDFPNIINIGELYSFGILKNKK